MNIRSVKTAASLLCLFTLSLPAFAWDIGDLMRDLARQKTGHAQFTEKKYIALLDKPVVSSGQLLYVAPDRLEKRTVQPKPELLLLDRDTLTIERGKQKLALRLSDYPEAIAFVDSIRGTLSGNRAVLERSYGLHLAGTAERWTLNLLPSDQRIATLVTRITVSGSRAQVRTIEYVQADGDRSLMTIEPIDTR